MKDKEQTQEEVNYQVSINFYLKEIRPRDEWDGLTKMIKRENDRNKMNRDLAFGGVSEDPNLYKNKKVGS